MAASGFVLFACLAAPLLPVPDTACIAACAVGLAAYFLYLSQVYCEAHVGAHVTVLVPPFLLLFALAPAWHSESADEATVAAATGFTVRMLQLILIYGINQQWGVPNLLFAMGDDLIQTVAEEFINMPMNIMMSLMVPDGAEGTVFALVNSLQTVGSSTSGAISAVLTAALVRSPTAERAMCSMQTLL